MKNTALPQSEVELVNKALKIVQEIIDNHRNVHPDLEKLGEDSFSRVHTIMYLDFLKDFIISAKTLEEVMNLTEEELTEKLAKDGKTLEGFEKEVILKAMSDILKDQE